MTNEKKNLFKEHTDLIIIFVTILTSVLGSTIWITSSLNSLDHRLTVIETVMIMKNIMPEKIAVCEKKGE